MILEITIYFEPKFNVCKIISWGIIVVLTLGGIIMSSFATATFCEDWSYLFSMSGLFGMTADLLILQSVIAVAKTKLNK